MKWKFWFLILFILWCIGYLISGNLEQNDQKWTLDYLKSFKFIKEGDFELSWFFVYQFWWMEILGTLNWTGEKDKQRMKSDFLFSFEQKGEEIAENWEFAWTGVVFGEGKKFRGMLQTWSWFGGVWNVQNGLWQEKISLIKQVSLWIDLQKSQVYLMLQDFVSSFRTLKVPWTLEFWWRAFELSEKEGVLIFQSKEKVWNHFWGELMGKRDGDKFVFSWYLGKRSLNFQILWDKWQVKSDFLLVEALWGGEKIQWSTILKQNKIKKSLQSFAKSYTPLHEYLARLNIEF